MTDALETESDRTQLGRGSPKLIRGKCRPLLCSQYREQTNAEVTAATPAALGARPHISGGRLAALKGTSV